VKTYSFIFILPLSTALILTGCGKKQEAPAAPVSVPEKKVEPPSTPEPPAAEAPMTEEPANTLMETAAAATEEASNLVTSFENADEKLKAAMEQALAISKEGKYQESLTAFQNLLTQFNVTPEQKQLIQDLIAQTQKNIATAAAQEALADPDTAVSEAEKTIDNLKESLPFGK